MRIHYCTQGPPGVQCGAEAVARFYLSEGCVAQRGEREQDLCYHHVMRASPLGSFELRQDYTIDGAFRRAWERASV